MLRVIKAFFPAVLLCYLLASLVVTQLNLASVQGLGIPVPFDVRLGASLHDLVGLSSSYLLLILVGFIVAMPVAAGLARMSAGRPAWLYGLAGFVAIVTIHLLIKSLLGLHGIAASRTVLGLMAQGLAGAAGGWLYWVLSRPRS